MSGGRGEREELPGNEECFVRIYRATSVWVVVVVVMVMVVMVVMMVVMVVPMMIVRLVVAVLIVVVVFVGGANACLCAGSPRHNWHSIFRNGLKNYSGTGRMVVRKNARGGGLSTGGASR